MKNRKIKNRYSMSCRLIEQRFIFLLLMILILQMYKFTAFFKTFTNL